MKEKWKEPWKYKWIQTTRTSWEEKRKVIIEKSSASFGSLAIVKILLSTNIAAFDSPKRYSNCKENLLNQKQAAKKHCERGCLLTIPPKLLSCEKKKHGLHENEPVQMEILLESVLSFCFYLFTKSRTFVCFHEATRTTQSIFFHDTVVNHSFQKARKVFVDKWTRKTVWRMKSKFSLVWSNNFPWGPCFCPKIAKHNF